jgi:signal transduction histidine kinase
VPALRATLSNWVGRLTMPGSDGKRPLWHALHPARWPLLLACGVIVLLALFGALTTEGSSGGLTLTQAWAVRGSSPAFPDGAAAQRVDLPHGWDRGLRDDQPVWYRMEFEVPSRGFGLGMPAVYLARVCAHYVVRLNGQFIASRGSGADPRPTDCHEPALIDLPPGLLRERGNLLDIQVRALPLRKAAARERAGALSEVRIGAHPALEADLKRARLLQVTLPLALLAVCGVVGVAALLLAVGAKLPYLAYFGAAALGWSVLCSLLLGGDLPLPMLGVEVVITALTPPVAIAAILFLLRYCGLRIDWLESSLSLQCLFVLLGLAVALPERVYTVAQPWAVILVTELLAALGVFLYRAWHVSRTDFYLTAAAAGSGAVVLIAELALIPGPALLPGKLAISASVLVMIAGTVWRVQQVQRATVAAAEQARVAAEKRAQDVSADMEHNYDRMAELRVEQVTAKERKRIAADLHDDLGAKLLTIVHTSESDRISTLAREALEEMRLSVRGLTGKAVQLGDAIGDWRSEIMMRLSQGGVELAWDTPDELTFSERAFSARAYVQTTRILREAVSNVLKHSGASHCQISIRQDHNDFELTISDNGKGIPMEMDGRLDRGHGMSTMKGRAKQLQGQCLVESGPGYGTTIRLTLPL